MNTNTDRSVLSATPRRALNDLRNLNVHPTTPFPAKRGLTNVDVVKRTQVFSPVVETPSVDFSSKQTSVFQRTNYDDLDDLIAKASGPSKFEVYNDDEDDNEPIDTVERLNNSSPSLFSQLMDDSSEDNVLYDEVPVSSDPLPMLEQSLSDIVLEDDKWDGSEVESGYPKELEFSFLDEECREREDMVLTGAAPISTWVPYVDEELEQTPIDENKHRLTLELLSQMDFNSFEY